MQQTPGNNGFSARSLTGTSIYKEFWLMARRSLWALSLALPILSGCYSASASRASLENRTTAVASLEEHASRKASDSRKLQKYNELRQASHSQAAAADRTGDTSGTVAGDRGITLASHTQLDNGRPARDDYSDFSGPSLSERLKIPKDLPGAHASPIALPPLDPAKPESRQSAIDNLFPHLPTPPAARVAESTPTEAPLTLDELQEIALNNNPSIVEATADINAQIGAAIQAGTYPNPEVGYEADTVGSSGTRNYQGVFFTQLIKTAGKLDLARAAENVGLMNTQVALRDTRMTLFANVRTGYFAVLVAQESLKANTALVEFTHEAYRIQVEQLKGGQATAYEPMQLRALAVEARTTLAQAHNRYASAWRQLAASLGIPDMPPRTLAGSADNPFELVDYDAALDYVLTNNTDVLTAQNAVTQARLRLRLEEVTPIPDVNVYGAIQKDFTSTPKTRTTYNLQVGIPVPIFNRNKGNIITAQGALVKASAGVQRVRNDLSAQLAAAYERYENNRVATEYYRTQVLPDLARAYRGVYERHQQESEMVSFGDVVLAQQQLLTAITTYIRTLGEQWTALCEISNLLQVDNLDQMEAGQLPVGPIPVPDALPIENADNL